MSGRVSIAGGKCRGTNLAVPPGARPTTGKVREALFSIVSPWLAGARVLDLYAGSGVLGLEALSRGADSVVAIEVDRGAAAAIRANVTKVGEATRHRLRVGRVETELGLLMGQQFDIVLADPPYALTGVEAVLTQIATVMAPGARLVLERSSRSPPLETAALVLQDRRRYGESALEIFGASESGEGE